MVDMEHLRKSAGIEEDVLAKLEASVSKDFPGDAAMAELHLIRTLIAIKQGWLTAREALKETAGSGTARES